MVIHLKTGAYYFGRDKILCNRFIKNGKPNTTNEKEKVTCGLCLRIMNGYK